MPLFFKKSKAKSGLEPKIINPPENSGPISDDSGHDSKFIATSSEKLTSTSAENVSNFSSNLESKEPKVETKLTQKSSTTSKPSTRKNSLKKSLVKYRFSFSQHPPLQGFKCSYTKSKLLGEGGFAKVYAVKHLETQEKFAAKTVTKDFARKRTEPNGEKVDDTAFHTEVRINLKLTHPNIIHLYNYYETPKKILRVIKKLLQKWINFT